MSCVTKWSLLATLPSHTSPVRPSPRSPSHCPGCSSSLHCPGAPSSSSGQGVLSSLCARLTHAMSVLLPPGRLTLSPGLTLSVYTHHHPLATRIYLAVSHGTRLSSFPPNPPSFGTTRLRKCHPLSRPLPTPSVLSPPSRCHQGISSTKSWPFSLNTFQVRPLLSFPVAITCTLVAVTPQWVHSTQTETGTHSSLSGLRAFSVASPSTLPAARGACLRSRSDRVPSGPCRHPRDKARLLSMVRRPVEGAPAHLSAFTPREHLEPCVLGRRTFSFPRQASKTPGRGMGHVRPARGHGARYLTALYHPCQPWSKGAPSPVTPEVLRSRWEM